MQDFTETSFARRLMPLDLGLALQNNLDLIYLPGWWVSKKHHSFFHYRFLRKNRRNRGQILLYKIQSDGKWEDPSYWCFSPWATSNSQHLRQCINQQDMEGYFGHGFALVSSSQHKRENSVRGEIKMWNHRLVFWLLLSDPYSQSVNAF